MRRIVFAAMIWVFYPGVAQAYVDPGFLGSLYQMIYMFIFGVAAAWVLKPFRYISALYKRMKDRLTEKNS